MENMCYKRLRVLNDQIRLDRQKERTNASINSIIDLQNKDVDFILDESSKLYEFIDQKKLRI